MLPKCLSDALHPGNVMQGLLVAGVAAFILASYLHAPQNQVDYPTVTRPTINQACAPERDPGSNSFVKVNLDVVLASGMLLKHPEKMKEVCSVVQNTYSAVIARAMDGHKSPKADNSNIEALADSLGMTSKMAESVIAMTAANSAANTQILPAAQASVPTMEMSP